MLGFLLAASLAAEQPAKADGSNPFEGYQDYEEPAYKPPATAEHGANPFAAYAEDDVELNPPPAARLPEPEGSNNPIIIGLLAAIAAALGLIAWRWRK